MFMISRRSSKRNIPIRKMPASHSRYRTLLGTPLLREGIPIGVIGDPPDRSSAVHRQTDRSAQNLRRSGRDRHRERPAVQGNPGAQRRIARSSGASDGDRRGAQHHQPLADGRAAGLDAIVESAARVCGIDDVMLRLREGDVMVPRAHFGPIPIGRVEISIDEPQYRWMHEHGTLHIPDVRAQKDFPTLGSAGGWRTFLIVPLRQQGELVGTLNARRTEVRPFTPAQIKLLETFADQAVIALENVRLFKELKESLEQQTATSEILGVIASSPTDIQPVLDTIAANSRASVRCERCFD